MRSVLRESEITFNMCGTTFSKCSHCTVLYLGICAYSQRRPLDRKHPKRMQFIRGIMKGSCIFCVLVRKHTKYLHRNENEKNVYSLTEKCIRGPDDVSLLLDRLRYNMCLLQNVCTLIWENSFIFFPHMCVRIN